MSEELLGCPFCGDEPSIRKRMDEDIWTHNTVEWVGVHCAECGISFEWPPDAEPSAVEQWNTRATPPAPTPSAAELRDLADLARAVPGTLITHDGPNAPQFERIASILEGLVLLPDAAAIRAAAFEEAAKIADGIMYPDFEASSDLEKQAYDIRCSIAAALREAGRRGS